VHVRDAARSPKKPRRFSAPWRSVARHYATALTRQDADFSTVSSDAVSDGSPIAMTDLKSSRVLHHTNCTFDPPLGSFWADRAECRSAPPESARRAAWAAIGQQTSEITLTQPCGLSRPNIRKPA
jgi:hypothetical protein